MPKAIFRKDEEWRPIKGIEGCEFKWMVSNLGRVRADAFDFYVTPYVRNGDVYVKLATEDNVYIESALAAILLTSFPESGN